MNKYKTYTYINPYGHTVTLTLTLEELRSIRPYIQLIKTSNYTHIDISKYSDT